MFIDEAEIIFRAGDGGGGKVSFYPGEKSGPDGGNGGDGGDLYVEADSQMTNLNQYLRKSKISAENGKGGGSNKRSGADGRDTVVLLPVGSNLLDENTLEEIDLGVDGQKVLLCKGGRGGRGNFELRSSSNTTPMKAETGKKGEEKHIKIIVRMIADFGLIGLPNAGKSSLLNELTNASVKVAGYPFTTIEPALGVFSKKVIADIPGLIEGAHKGRGLGINFLKHIEKVKLLIHCISSESEDVKKDYETIMQEMENFSSELIEKKQIILLTKSDLKDKKELEKKIKRLKKVNDIVLGVSILDDGSLLILKEKLQNIV